LPGQHLAVRVDVDPLALGLFEQFLQVFEIVPRDQDALALDRRDADLRRLGMAVGFRIGRVEQLHRLEVDLARLEGFGQQIVGVGRARGQIVEHLVKGRIQGRVFLAQNLRVVCISARPLEAIDDQLLQAGRGIAQLLDPMRDGDLLPPGDQSRKIVRPFPPRHGTTQCLRRLARLLGRLFVELLSLGLDRGRLLEKGAEPPWIEIDIRQRTEQRPDHKHVDVAVPRAQFCGPMGVAGEVLGRVDQEVLQRRGLRVLAADPPRRAAAAFRRLLTLVTEHTHTGYLPLLSGYVNAVMRRTNAMQSAARFLF